MAPFSHLCHGSEIQEETPHTGTISRKAHDSPDPKVHPHNPHSRTRAPLSSQKRLRYPMSSKEGRWRRNSALPLSAFAAFPRMRKYPPTRESPHNAARPHRNYGSGSPLFFLPKPLSALHKSFWHETTHKNSYAPREYISRHPVQSPHTFPPAPASPSWPIPA